MANKSGNEIVLKASGEWVPIWSVCAPLDRNLDHIMEVYEIQTHRRPVGEFVPSVIKVRKLPIESLRVWPPLPQSRTQRRLFGGPNGLNSTDPRLPRPRPRPDPDPIDNRPDPTRPQLPDGDDPDPIPARPRPDPDLIPTRSTKGPLQAAPNSTRTRPRTSPTRPDPTRGPIQPAPNSKRSQAGSASRSGSRSGSGRGGSGSFGVVSVSSWGRVGSGLLFGWVGSG